MLAKLFASESAKLTAMTRPPASILIAPMLASVLLLDAAKCKAVARDPVSEPDLMSIFCISDNLLSFATER